MGRGNRRLFVLRIRDFEKPDIFCPTDKERSKATREKRRQRRKAMQEPVLGQTYPKTQQCRE
ncbi:hypothetical protein BDW60DRAFT_182653 [Aspergillus nidulans var. acristatus]